TFSIFKMQQFFIVFLVSICSYTSALGSTKVFELGDSFLDVKNEGIWFVKCFAPWCAHCKKLEPVWKQVAQFLGPQGFRVGRIDCTRFPNVCSEINVTGYPQIMLFKGDEVVTYNGDRNRESIIDFGLRVAGPPVRILRDPADFKDVARTYDNFFTYLGDRQGDLWDKYEAAAKKYLAFNYFFAASPSCAEQKIKLKKYPAVAVYKDGRFQLYDESNQIKAEALRSSEANSESGDEGTSLNHWVNKERFSRFVKVTAGNFSQVARSGKLLVLAVLEENKIGEMTASMKVFRRMMEEVSKMSSEKYSNKYQFGWVGNPDLINPIVMERIIPPSLIVIDPKNEVHYTSGDLPEKLTEEAVLLFLTNIEEGTIQAEGGSGLFTRIQRTYFQARISLEDMWRGNPILTAVLFGLPVGFFILICYSICCSDIMDADDDEDTHEKKD
ncbi:hypothetical protein QYM36_000962, partial [Artemia franciscana]